MNQEEEKDLRENIRYLIRHVKEKRADQEELLRTLIREMADCELKLLTEAGQVPDNSPTPNKSTGINVLEDLLKKIIPVLETDYKLLTTSEEQRQSFRSHIVQAVVSTLTPAITNNDAVGGTGGEPELDEAISVEEEIEIDVGDEDDEKFIDIRTDSEKVDDEEEVEEDPVDSFGIEGEDETGRNMAYQSFKKIESSVIDSYELLSNAEDQELFYDYLIANLKLYFDKFETELADQVSEPTNQAYDTAKSEEEAVETGFDTVGAGEEEVELEL